MKSAKDLLVLIIGQTPRPDLLAPLQNTLATVSKKPRSTRVIGALDGLSQVALEAVTTKGTTAHVMGTSCPLITKLADGSTVTILEEKVGQLMADKLEEARGSFDVATVLCAGDFRHLHKLQHLSATPGTVVVPFEAALADTVAGLTKLDNTPKMSRARVACLVPTEAQVPFSVTRWTKGLRHYFPEPQVHAHVLPPEAASSPNAGQEAFNIIRTVDGGDQYDAAVIDFVGHPPSLVASLREHMKSENEPTVAIDVGESAMLAMKKILDHP